MPIPIPSGSKNPNRPGWQKERYSEDEILTGFPPDSNIGLLLGEPSGGLIDIDLDWPEARLIAPEILPATNMMSGRTSAPYSHFWYICSESIRTTKFLNPEANDDERAMIVEFRSTGGQTVVAPSIHPSGEHYVWYGALDPAISNANKLLNRVASLAACCLVSRHWQYGKRHNTALALAGTLLRAGWLLQSVEKFIRLAATAAGDDEIEDRVRTVETTLARIQDGEKATGLPSLSELLGNKIVGCLQKWLKLPSEPFEPAQEAEPEEWTEPEPLPIGLLPVPEMSEELLPEPFRDWLCDIADRMQCPLEYPTVAALVSLSSIIGDRIAIRPKRHDDWAVTPNHWGAIIGPPGLLKTPALEEGMRPLKRLVVEARKDHQERMKAWEFEKLRIEAERRNLKDQILKAVREGKSTEAFRDHLAALELQSEPVEHRYIVNDSTVEKLGELLNQNPHGLLVFRDELTGWLRTLDREGHESDRAFYLEAWNGHGSFSYDRIGRGTLHIESVTLSILGGIQPGPLSQYLRSALSGGIGDDGLMQRFQLLVYPDPPTNWKNIDRYPDTAAKNKAFEIYKQLDSINGISFSASSESEDMLFLQFDAEAQELFDSWRGDLERELRSGKIEHPAVEVHLSKYRSLMPGLALLFYLVDKVDGQTEQANITLDSAAKAAAWCSFLFEHAKRVYGMAINASARLAKSLARHIQQGDLTDPFTARDVYLKHWAGLSTAKDVAEPLDLLVALNWLRPILIQTGGRPTQHYFINPKVRRVAE